MLPLLALGAVAGSALGLVAGKILSIIVPTAKPVAKNAGSTKTYPFRFVRESVIQEESIVLAVEDVPLDNRFGTRVLASEHEFSRTATTDLKLAQTRELDSSYKYDARVLESIAKARFAKQFGMEMGSQINRRIRLKFEADPGHFVHYRVIWKQESQRGTLEFEVGSHSYQLPYLVTYGLYHSVESLPIDKKEPKTTAS